MNRLLKQLSGMSRSSIFITHQLSLYHLYVEYYEQIITPTPTTVLTTSSSVVLSDQHPVVRQNYPIPFNELYTSYETWFNTHCVDMGRRAGRKIFGGILAELEMRCAHFVMLGKGRITSWVSRRVICKTSL